jgi:hypothetical protein
MENEELETFTRIVEPDGTEKKTVFYPDGSQKKFLNGKEVKNL